VTSSEVRRLLKRLDQWRTQTSSAERWAARWRRRKTASIKPSIEAFEDRTLLSIAWTADMPGEWSDQNNWLDDMGNHRVPGAGDDVVLPSFPASEGPYTVSRNGACRSLSLSDPSVLSISSTLGVYGPATLDGAVNLDSNGVLESRAGDPWTFGNSGVTLAGRLDLPGHLSTATGSSAINGPVTWTGGTILGGTSTHPVMLNNTIAISGPDSKVLGAFMDVNQGAQIVHQGGDLDDGAATLNLKGTYELQSDASVTSGLDTGGIFNLKSGGTLLKSGGSGVSTVGGNFTINAGGQVVDQTGTLKLQLAAFNANVDDTGGTFTVTQGARVILAPGVGSSNPAKLMGTYTGLDRGTVELHTNIAVSPGTAFNFAGPVDPPNGNTSQVIPHTTLAENGLSNIIAPVNSLVGVFLGPDQPDQSPPPDTLDFSSPDSRDYASLAPALKQVFYIGDGMTSSGGQHQVTVPAGATRLYLGPMDGFEWLNDVGAFSVQIGVNGIPLDNSFPVLVPATSDPWLAGMPDGSTASEDDVAPAQSPALVPDLAVNGGDVLTFTGKGSVNFYPSMFEWTAGNIFSQSGGTLTNTGSMRIAPSNLNGMALEAPFNNSRTITQTAGSWGIGASGVLNNHGFYDLQTDGPAMGGSVFNNESDGIFRKSLNAGLANPNFSAFNNHGGTIDVQRGTLDLRNTSGTRTGSTFYVADGSTLIPFGGTFTGTYTGAKAGSGVVDFDVAITAGTGGATLDFEQDGMLQLRAASLNAGPDGLINNGSLTLIGSSHHFVAGSGGLTNNCKIIHTGSGGLALTFGTALVNNGFYDLQGDASVGVQQGGTFQNSGSFVKSQGTGTSTNNHWVNTLAGTIDVESGTLSLTDSFANDGFVIIAAGRTLQVGVTYSQGNTGLLAMQLAGTDPTQVSLLHAGSVTLDGTLSVSLVNPFVPPVPATFQILTFGSGSGQFARVFLPVFDGGHFDDPHYSPVDVTLVTTADGPSPSPPPPFDPRGSRAGETDSLPMRNIPIIAPGIVSLPELLPSASRSRANQDAIAVVFSQWDNSLDNKGMLIQNLLDEIGTRPIPGAP
jgi:hypothetical protein